jgi:hypothetical protein
MRTALAHPDHIPRWDGNSMQGRNEAAANKAKSTLQKGLAASTGSTQALELDGRKTDQNRKKPPILETSIWDRLSTEAGAMNRLLALREEDWMKMREGLSAWTASVLHDRFLVKCLRAILLLRGLVNRDSFSRN